MTNPYDLIASFHRGVREAPDLSVQIEVLEEMLSKFGYDEFILGALPVLSPDQTPLLISIDNIDADWRAEYDSNDYAKYDLAVQHCMQSDEPILWSAWHRAGDLPEMPAGFRRVIERARHFEYTAGVTIPLFTYWSPFRFGMSLIRKNDRDLDKHDADFEENRELWITVAQIFFNYAKLKQKFIKDYELDEPELLLLKLIAFGQSRAQIARDQGIHVNSVKNRLNKIFGKLKVHNSEQALMIYSLLGLHANAH